MSPPSARIDARSRIFRNSRTLPGHWYSTSDSDAQGNRENLLRMIALRERLPELIIVPAHDMRAFADMPTLSAKPETPSEVGPVASR